MLRLQFQPMFGAEAVYGPVPKIVVLRGLVVDKDERPVAHYEAPFWVLRDTGHSFISVEVKPAVVIAFSRSSTRKLSGPHSHVLFADGHLYAGPSPICKFDDAKQAWLELGTSESWSGFEITPAAL